MTTVYSPEVLRTTTSADLPGRLARSARAREGVHMPTELFDTWLAERRLAHPFRVEQVPFADLDGWSLDPVTGNIGHRSGRFFTVEGIRALSAEGPAQAWEQPIIRQPEVGILGILVKDFGGVPHFLMQAKMEPGNPNLLQLSPTVQATRSNYTRVHQGSPVPYLEHFAGAKRGRLIADVLQSEHGAWFYHKSNRNMLIETTDEVELGDDFCWLTLGQINDLLKRDNVVNMDSRTVLSCLTPFLSGEDAPVGAFGGALAASRDPRAAVLAPAAEVLSWFTGRRSDRELDATTVPLNEIVGWERTATEISRADGRFFRVIGVSVQAGSREVGGWSQPLFAPSSQGVVALVVKRIGGVLHLLMRARAEVGFLDTVELGPTVQCLPDNYGPADRPFLVDEVLTADPARIHYDAVHSEEGGRFLNAESRHLIVEADDSFPTGLPSDYAWFTVGQLAGLLRHNHYVNVQARTMVACLNALG